jgi:hypothetical protein
MAGEGALVRRAGELLTDGKDVAGMEDITMDADLALSECRASDAMSADAGGGHGGVWN